MIRRRRRTAATPAAGPDHRIAELQHRLEHLEAAFEGLQDAIHRQSQRHDKELRELTRSMRPDAMARALSDDARRRGV